MYLKCVLSRSYFTLHQCFGHRSTLPDKSTLCIFVNTGKIFYTETHTYCDHHITFLLVGKIIGWK